MAAAAAARLSPPWRRRMAAGSESQRGSSPTHSGVPRLRDVEEDGGPSYQVLTGSYDTAARWESRPIAVGTPLSPPKPLFAKLDSSVVDEELARLERS